MNSLIENKILQMRSILFFLILIMAISCNKQISDNLPEPNNITNLRAEPRIGGALLKWDIPDSSNYMYLEVSYDKNGKKVVQNVPNNVDSVLIEGLINKENYTFFVQPFIRGINDVVSGTVISTTTAISPIRRPVNEVFFPSDITKVPVTADMAETYTQETTEGPKRNLFDGDMTTFWHTAWSAGVQPLPHWIKLSFEQPQKIGVIKYYLRQTSNTAGCPSQFGLDVSNDGTTWTRVWTSNAGLSVANLATEKTLVLDKNYESKFFRILILQTPGNTTYTHLGDISFYNMRSEVLDLEEEAEKNY